MGNVKRKRTDRAGNRVAIIAITIVVASLALVLQLRVNTLKAKQEQYMEKEQALLAQVAQEEERAQTLEEYRVYVQTKEYIEKVAKEKLGLVNSDEILVKPSE